MMPTRLIVNADDYGLTAGVSAGIRHAHLNGVVTSTTALMNRPEVEAELVTAATGCPKLGLGVHLNLTTGDPILPPSLVPSVMRVRDECDHGLYRVAMIGQLRMSEVEAEWRAQIEKFVRAIGRPPDHLDSHHHISYCTPELCRLMLALAREYQCPIRNPLINAGRQETIFDGLPIDLRERAQREVPVILMESIDVPKPMCLIAGFSDQNAALDGIAKLIESVPKGLSELMTHPGYTDSTLRKFSVYNDARESELAMLTDAALRDRVVANEIELVYFGQLKHEAEQMR